jgi:predicted kinase
MSAKLQLLKPTLFMLYGYPGAGKTYYARQLCEELQAAHVNSERVRQELFDDPRYDAQENQIVKQLMTYMTEEFLSAGLSVVFDANAMRQSSRRELRELARRHKAETVLVWFQIDADSSYMRSVNRDRRKYDDKYSIPINQEMFERMTSSMQNPTPNEDYLVISGKHTFKTQYQTTIRRLYDSGLLHADQSSHGKAKPGLVNLVPNPLAGRVDPSRRNISIRQ